jgi:drug/metabolite transporter (DMT)-like permease
VIALVGGLTAAVMWGGATVAASRSTRMIGSQQALAYVMLFGLATTVVLAGASGPPQDATGKAVAWAVVAGAASAFGLSMMYRALRLGKVGIVAPIASTEGALAAVFSVAFLGERLTVGVVACLAVIAAGVVVVTLHAGVADLHLRPALYAITAACSFGVGLVSSAEAGHALGPFWTILVARILGALVIALPLLVRGALPLPGRAWWLVLVSATGELVGFSGFIYGSRHGAAIPAVLGSQFAVVAAVASFVLFGERLRPRQVAAAAVIVAGVTALAVLRA